MRPEPDEIARLREMVHTEYSVSSHQVRTLFEEYDRLRTPPPAPRVVVTEAMKEAACAAVSPVATGHPWAALKDTRGGEILLEHIGIALTAAIADADAGGVVEGVPEANFGNPPRVVVTEAMVTDAIKNTNGRDDREWATEIAAHLTAALADSLADSLADADAGGDDA